MVLFSINQRSSPTSKSNVPFLSITCSGHQKTLATLFKERDILKKKLKEITKKKLNAEGSSAKTMKAISLPSVKRNKTLKKKTIQ